MKNEKTVKLLYNLSKLYRFKNKLEVKNDQYEPFFIIGSGRNGSTLLSSLLNNHSEIFIPLENYVLPFASIKYSLYNLLPWDDLSNIIISQFDDPTQTEHWEISMKKIYPIIHNIPKTERSFKRLLNEINLFYAKEKLQINKTCWGDKSPHNIRMIEYIVPIYAKSKYIFLVRDSRAVCNSLLKGKEEIFANHTTLEGAIGLWNHAANKLNWLQKQIPKNNLLIVKYEDLVSNQTKEIKSILKFLNFNFEDLEIDRLKNNSNLGFNKSEHHKNTSKPISTDYIKKWQTELSDKQIEKITKKTFKHLKKFNYI